MLKKLILCTLACLAHQLHAHPSSWLEIKPGYFFANHTLRKIYHGGYEIQASITRPLSDDIALYGSIGYIHARGKSLGEHQKTSISQVPLDLGVRAFASISKHTTAYLGAGPRFFYFHQRNNSSFVDPHVHTNGFGFFINGGWNYINRNGFIGGIFGEYAFQQQSFKSTMPNVYGRSDLQIGGFTFGASVGLEF